MSGERDRRGPKGADAAADSWHEETIPIRTREIPEPPDVSSVGRIEAPSTETPDFSEMTVPMRPAFVPSAPAAPDVERPSMPDTPGTPSVPGASSAPSAPSIGSLAGAGAGIGGGLPGGLGQAVGTAAAVAGAVGTAVAVGQMVAAGVSAIADALSAGETLPSVSYRFYPDDHGDLDWKVRSVRCTQGLSALYELHVGLAVEDLIVDPDELLGASAELLVERHALTQRVSGIITRVTQTGLANGHQLVDLRVAPALEALTQRFNHRVPEIVKAVMTESLANLRVNRPCFR